MIVSSYCDWIIEEYWFCVHMCDVVVRDGGSEMGVSSASGDTVDVSVNESRSGEMIRWCSIGLTEVLSVC